MKDGVQLSRERGAGGILTDGRAADDHWSEREERLCELGEVHLHSDRDRRRSDQRAGVRIVIVDLVLGEVRAKRVGGQHHSTGDGDSGAQHAPERVRLFANELDVAG
jgi:hypothetical protein